jgi:hypothetical protein
MAIRRRNLNAHNELLRKVITDQAGTLGKGVLEGVMNGREAGSDEVRIITQPDGAKLVIEDDGKGFRNATEIEEWFEKFGTPHSEAEQKKWARFRMGRGQLFAFGRNVWRTGKFRMVVDVQEWGLEYELEDDLEHFPGCRIEIDLYQPMFGDYPHPYRSPSQFKSVVRKQVLYMEGAILVDGEQVNTPASMLKWDLETDNWYFSFKHGTNFDWYNMGAFVMDWSPRRAGVTGVAVSKVAVDVNYARNDIKDACPVYQEGKVIVADNKVKKVRKSQRRLNENEKVSMLIDLRDGVCPYDEIRNLGLFMTCSDRPMSLEAIKKIRSPWTFAPRDSRIADKLIQTGTAICLSDDILADLEYTGEQAGFFDWLLDIADGDHGRGYGRSLLEQFRVMKKFWRSFDGSDDDKGLSSGYNLEHTIIPSDKLTKGERLFLRVMQDMDIWKGRVLCIGISDTANGWTDGHSYIAFNRQYLKEHFPNSSYGAAAMMTLAFHEMAHDTDDTGSHFHGAEFYEAYHDMTRGTSLHWIGTLAYKMRRAKNEDKAAELAEKARKAEERREKKLGVKKVMAKVNGNGKGLTHKPTKAATPRKTKAKKASKRARRF